MEGLPTPPHRVETRSFTQSPTLQFTTRRMDSCDAPHWAHQCSPSPHVGAAHPSRRPGAASRTWRCRVPGRGLKDRVGRVMACDRRGSLGRVSASTQKASAYVGVRMYCTSFLLSPQIRDSVASGLLTEETINYPNLLVSRPSRPFRCSITPQCITPQIILTDSC